jgi:hypothetical protein
MFPFWYFWSIIIIPIVIFKRRVFFDYIITLLQFHGSNYLRCIAPYAPPPPSKPLYCFYCKRWVGTVLLRHFRFMTSSVSVSQHFYPKICWCHQIPYQSIPIPHVDVSSVFVETIRHFIALIFKISSFTHKSGNVVHFISSWSNRPPSKEESCCLAFSACTRLAESLLGKLQCFHIRHSWIVWHILQGESSSHKLQLYYLFPFWRNSYLLCMLSISVRAISEVGHMSPVYMAIVFHVIGNKNVSCLQIRNIVMSWVMHMPEAI